MNTIQNWWRERFGKSNQIDPNIQTPHGLSVWNKVKKNKVDNIPFQTTEATEVNKIPLAVVEPVRLSSSKKHKASKSVQEVSPSKQNMDVFLVRKTKSNVEKTGTDAVVNGVSIEEAFVVGDNESRKHSEPQTPPHAGKTIKFLVVDDTSSILTFLEKSIKNHLGKHGMIIDADKSATRKQALTSKKTYEGVTRKQVPASFRQKYEGVTLTLFTASNCADAMDIYKDNKDLNLVLLDYDLDSVPSKCDDEKKYFCCKDETTAYKSYFDTTNHTSHSQHNGIELARSLYNKGYRNAFALQTSHHLPNKTDVDEQRSINTFYRKTSMNSKSSL